MKTLIQRTFSPPVFIGDEEKTRRAGLLNTITNTIIILVLVVGLGALLGGDTPTSAYILEFLMIADVLLLRRWLFEGKITLAGKWLEISGLVLVTLVIASAGTIRSPATAAYLLLVVTAGLLFGLRGIVASTLACSLAVLALMLAENAGMLPRPDYTVNISQWVTYTALVGLTGVLSYHENNTIQKALEETKKEIEERRRVEVELRKLTRAVQQSPAAIVITDLAGTIEYVNLRFSQLTGYSNAEAVGKNPRLLKTDQTPPETYLQLWATLTAGKDWRGEFTNRKKDGSTYYEVATISPITGVNGAITHYLGVLEDITESKRIRQNIVAQRDLAQALAGTASIRAAAKLCLEHALEAANLDCGGIYLVDRATRDLELVVSQGLSEAFVQNAACAPAGSLRWQIVMAGKAVYTLYEQIRTQNSPALISEGLRAFGLIPVLHQGQVIACFNLASHHLDEIAPVSRDFIEEIALQVGNALVRIRTQEDLQQSHDELALSEARFRSLFEQTHDAVVMLDLKGHLLAANQRAADLLGYTPDEIRTLSVNDTSAEPAGSQDSIRRLLAGEPLPLYERRFRKKDGQIFAAEVSLELIRDSHGNPSHIQSVLRDISERKQAEEALKSSEKRYRLISENAADVIWVLDFDSRRFTYVSPSVEKLRGYTVEEVLAQSMAEVMTPASLKHLNEVLPGRLAAHLQEGAPKSSYVDRIDQPHKDGHLVHTETNTSVVLKESGGMEVVGVSRDITERVKLETAIEKSQRRFRALLENSADALTILNAQAEVIYEGPNNIRLTGFAPGERYGLDAFGSVYPDDLPTLRAAYGRLTATPFHQEQAEARFRRKDGTLWWANITGTNLLQHPDVEGIVLNYHDISERKRAEAALRESEAKYRIVADNTYDWEFWTAPSGQFLYVSPSCRAISGYEVDEFKADQALLTRIVYPDDKEIVQRHLERLQHREKDEVDYRIVRQDGGVRWVSHICTPIFDENGVDLGNRGSNRDITRRKEVEDKLHQVNQQLEDQLDLVTQLKDQLHEQSLRDPLTGLHNRRYLVEVLPREIIRAGREHSCVSVIMADIDHFKEVNDRFGHAAGDEVLKVMARLITSHARGSDVSCRYGGEEFLLVLPGATLASGVKRAEQLRQTCADTNFHIEGQEIKLTLSFGVATFPDHGKKMDELLINADRALYISKNAGRNRATAWDEAQRSAE